MEAYETCGVSMETHLILYTNLRNPTEIYSIL